MAAHEQWRVAFIGWNSKAEGTSVALLQGPLNAYNGKRVHGRRGAAFGGPLRNGRAPESARIAWVAQSMRALSIDATGPPPDSPLQLSREPVGEVQWCTEWVKKRPAPAIGIPAQYRPRLRLPTRRLDEFWRSIWGPKKSGLS